MGVALRTDIETHAVVDMLDSMQLFAMGFSWGGFESLLIGGRKRPGRSPESLTEHGPTLRLYAGLEDVDDLIADLKSGFDGLVKNGRKP